jgi:hypothetical protein
LLPAVIAVSADALTYVSASAINASVRRSADVTITCDDAAFAIFPLRLDCLQKSTQPIKPATNKFAFDQPRFVAAGWIEKLWCVKVTKYGESGWWQIQLVRVAPNTTENIEILFWPIIIVDVRVLDVEFADLGVKVPNETWNVLHFHVPHLAMGR